MNLRNLNTIILWSLTYILTQGNLKNACCTISIVICKFEIMRMAFAERFQIISLDGADAAIIQGIISRFVRLFPIQLMSTEIIED